MEGITTRSRKKEIRPGTVADREAAELTFSTTTRPGRRQVAVAAVVTCILVLAGIATTPFAGQPLTPVPAFMTAFGTGMLVINVLLAALLLSKGSIERRAEAIYLGAAYLLVAAIFVPLTLSFKDAFVPGCLIGTPASAVWLWSFWHCGFGISIGWYAFSLGRVRYAPSISTVIVCVIGFVCLVAVLATVGVDRFPPLLWNGRTFFDGPLFWIPVGLILLNAIAFLLCLRLGARTSEQLWVTVAMVAACFDLWLTAHGANRYALGWYLSKCGSLATSLIVLTSMFFDISRLYRTSAEANRTLGMLAHRDGLTGLYNRRHFDAALSTEWRRAKREQLPLSLLMVDVDRFKPYNDEYGHLAGDECLKSVAACLATAVRRPADLVTRFGGEEFAVLLPNTDQAGCLIAGENLRASVERLALPHKHGQSGIVTVSIGASTSCLDAGSSAEALIRASDDLLYRAKRLGRNQVVSVGAQTFADVPPSDRHDGSLILDKAGMVTEV